jgi:hypothetical protein
MKYEFIFLCLVIPGPDHLGTKIDVMMRPWLKTLNFCDDQDEVEVPPKRKRVSRKKKSTWFPFNRRKRLNPNFDYDYDYRVWNCTLFTYFLISFIILYFILYSYLD